MILPTEIAAIASLPRHRLAAFALVAILALSLARGSAETFDKTLKPASRDIAGWWYLELPNMPMRFLMKLSRQRDGTLSGTHANLAMGEKDLPMRPLFYNPPDLRFEMDWFNGVMQLSLNDDSQKLVGAFKGGDMRFPLAYVRVEPSKFPPPPKKVYKFRAGEARDLRGYWLATSERDGTKFHYGLQIGRLPDGSFAGTYDLFESGQRDTPLPLVLFTNGHVRLEYKAFNFSFDGALSADGRTLIGKATEWKDSRELKFERREKPFEPELPRLTSRTGKNALRSVEGDWEALVDPQSSDMRTHIRIGRARDGRYLATFDNPDEPFAQPVPSTSAGVSNLTVHLEWKGRDTVFHGTLQSNGAELIGESEQDKTRTLLVFKRVQAGGAK